MRNSFRSATGFRSRRAARGAATGAWVDAAGARPTAGAACESLERRTLLAATLVKDIVPGTDSSFPSGLFAFRDNLFFTARNPTTGGNDLWKSDGTSLGTSLVTSTVGTGYTPVGNTIFFVGPYPQESLWATDGTPAGTRRLRAFDPTNSDYVGEPTNLTAVGNTLFFSQSDLTAGPELWKSDGTAAGTVRVKDIVPGIDGSMPRALANVNGTLFFYARDGATGWELYKSDGTDAGTLLVKDVNPGPASSINAAVSDANTVMYSLNGLLYFTADDGVHGTELWRSDGTAGGTYMVKDLEPGPIGIFNITSPQPDIFADAGGTLYFGSGQRLFKSNGTSAGTSLITQVQTSGSQTLTGFASAGGRAYFTSTDAIWTTDGTAAGTIPLRSWSFSVSGDSVRDLTDVNGRLYFDSPDPASDYELWTTDGTPSGTVPLTSIVTADDYTQTWSLTNVRGSVFFAPREDARGIEPWVLDPARTAPAAPAALAATAFSGGQIDLTWTDASTTESSFRLERSRGATFATIEATQVLLPGTTRFGDAGLAANTTYYYRLKSLNSGGASSAVTASAATPNAPAAPTNLTLPRVTGSAVDLAWTDVATDEQGYRVQRSRFADFRDVEITVDLPAGAAAYTDATVERFTPYYYRVFALHATRGNSAAATASATTPDVPPAAPSNLVAWGVSESEVNLSWTDNSDTESGFRIERSVAGGAFVEIGSVAAGKVTYRDFERAPAAVYSYRVRGANAAGAGAYSAVASASTLAPELTSLVRDVDPTPVAGNNSEPSRGVVLNGISYFAAADGRNGRELWRSDGTAAGTRLAVDVLPGRGWSSPEQITRVGDLIYFTADDSQYGRELWRSDGTPAGTARVTDLAAGAASAPIAGIVGTANGDVYFVSKDASGNELWKVDAAAPGGALMLKDINPGSADANPRLFAPIGNTLYFVAFSQPLGWELWKSDGTAVGTQLVADIAPGSEAGYPVSLTELNGKLLFTASSDFFNLALYESDGTAAGTTVVAPLPPGNYTLSSQSAVRANGLVYFTAISAAGTLELWKTDGTAAGTAVVDPTPPAMASAPAALAAVGNTVYFLSGLNTNSVRLCRTDPVEGTVVLKDIASGVGGTFDFELSTAGGKLFVVAGATNSSQYKVWSSDGTVAGTLPVGTYGGVRPNPVATLGSTFLFAAVGPGGHELWSSDGSVAGTAELVDIYLRNADGNPQSLTNLDGTLYYVARDPSVGEALWRTNPDTGATTLVRAGAASDLTVVGNALYFKASDATTGSELWRADASGAAMVKDITPGAGGTAIGAYAPAANGLYFTVREGDAYKLWRTDGTVANTAKVSDVNVNSYVDFGRNDNPVAIGGTVYFNGRTPNTNDGGLWKSDGTAAGTVRVTTDASGIGGFSPFGFTNLNGTLYFAAFHNTDGWGLWKTNGTAAGTAMVRAFPEGTGSSLIAMMGVIDGKIYFRAWDPVTGAELWRTDGTTAGTTLVADVYPGAGDGFPGGITKAGGTLYFRAWNAGINSLYATDGTPAGTRQVRELGNPSSGYQTWVVGVGDKLFFADGNALWRSDGTTTGTVQVQILNEFTGEPRTTSAVAVGDRLFFRGYDAVYGRELFSVSATPPAAPSELRVTGGSAALSASSVRGSRGASAAPSGGSRTAADSLAGASSLSAGAPSLTWRDNAANESGFIVQRSGTANFATVQLSAFVPAGSTGFTDLAAVAGQPAYYRVRAVNAAGDSTNSNVVTAGQPVATVSGWAVNDGRAQRSMITSASVSFTQAPSLAAGAFALTRRADGATIALTATPSSDGRTYVLTFPAAPASGNSLADGIYDLRLPDGTTRAFHRLYGDDDGDGDVDAADLFQLRSTVNKRRGDAGYKYWFDYDDSGVVDAADLFQLRSRVTKTFKGY